MQTVRFLLILVTLSFITFSCNKKETNTDPCTNGFLDAGEVAPDCGGNCPPCSTEPLNHVYSELNGVQTNFHTKSFGYNENYNSWVLVLENDSLNILLGSGPDGAVGTYDWDENTTFSYANSQYPIKQNGFISISEKSDNLVSGYFNGTFIRPASNLLPSDTIRILNGEFLELEY